MNYRERHEAEREKNAEAHPTKYEDFHVSVRGRSRRILYTGSFSQELPPRMTTSLLRFRKCLLRRSAKWFIQKPCPATGI